MERLFSAAFSASLIVLPRGPWHPPSAHGIYLQTEADSICRNCRLDICRFCMVLYSSSCFKLSNLGCPSSSSCSKKATKRLMCLMTRVAAQNRICGWPWMIHLLWVMVVGVFVGMPCDNYKNALSATKNPVSVQVNSGFRIAGEKPTDLMMQFSEPSNDLAPSSTEMKHFTNRNGMRVTLMCNALTARNVPECWGVCLFAGALITKLNEA